MGLHYKGWEYKREAEKGFRARELDVLVATSTVAAGVNMPARAVVVQDTEVGLKSIDVATVQQMFGRAGRVGAGENEGWAFLIVDDVERELRQRKLLAGFRVDSQIQDSFPERDRRDCALRVRIDAQESVACTTDELRFYVVVGDGADGIVNRPTGN